MKTRAGESRRAGSYATVVIGSALAAVAATSLAGQNYTLDDWMTVSSVGSYQWSPDGGYLYFTSNAASSGTAEIFRIPALGGDPVQLSENPPGERPEPKQQLTVSPDGQTLFLPVPTTSRPIPISSACRRRGGGHPKRSCSMTA